MKISMSWMLVSAGLALLANGCATAPPSGLVLARLSLDQATDSPAALLAPSYISDAQQSLDKANREFAANGDTGICRDYAYITQNKLEIAESVARAELARQSLAEKAARAQGTGSTAGAVVSSAP